MLPLFHAYWAQAVNFMWNTHGLVEGEKERKELSVNKTIFMHVAGVKLQINIFY